MDFQPIDAPSLTELFIDDLENKIFTGQLQPGDRLPPQRELAKTMNISQTIVNTGISVLAGRGLLKIVPRKGTFVVDCLHDGGLESLASLVNYSKKQLPSSTMYDMYTFRLSNEKTFFRLAAKNMSDSDYAQLNEYLNEIENSTSIEEESRLIFSAMKYISCKSKNIVYPMITNGFEGLYMTTFMRLLSVQKTKKHIEYYKRITAYMAAKDYSKMEQEIQDYQNYEMSTLKEYKFFN